MPREPNSSPLPSPRRADKEDSDSRIAHTLTACTRCRHRKTRCDPGLPRCGPCERVKAHCEYWDPARGMTIPRHYVVHLQHRVRELEQSLETLERDDYQPDPEEIVRGGADIRINKDDDDSKFLGPSSGIAITRLVMQLAKRFTQSDSINDIVAPNQAEQAKELYDEEEAKPTSKVYPIISNIAAPDLPPREMTTVLVKLFNLKVMTMYPYMHEPTFWGDVEDVYNGSKDPFQNFAVRMVIAISLQRYDSQYAGLADSFYLAALAFLEEAVTPMNVRTIQCFCLIGSYSLLTPTRTAVYYVIGLATRLCQALGLAEEKTILQGPHGQRANPLEIDMRRRLFWSVINMDFGLAHSMGRASSFATALEHIDVQWFELVDDEYLTAEGVTPNAPTSLRKWICIHFNKMRLLQLEIRRMLYQRKRPQPLNDSHPWFADMEKRLIEWRDAMPTTDAGTGLDKAWFVGRYHTMVVFMFRPSPQCPRPSLTAAERCFPACQSNIYMHQAQIKNGNVDTTWIFTQAVFMTINTILWTLSYEPIRKAHPRDEVEQDLTVALECIRVASERWPGVESALALYKTLIAACLRIYDREGDVDIAAGSPVDSTNMGSGASPLPSPSVSPVVQRGMIRYPPPKETPSELNSRVSAPPSAETLAADVGSGGFSFFNQTQAPAQHHQQAYTDTATLSPFSAVVSNPSGSARSSMEYQDAASAISATADVSPSYADGSSSSYIDAGSHSAAAASSSNTNLGLFQTPPAADQLPLPATYGNLVSWNPDFDFTTASPRVNIPALAPYDPTPPPMGSDYSTTSPPHTAYGNGGSSFPMEGSEQQQQQQQPQSAGGTTGPPQDGFPQWADYYFQPPPVLMSTGQNRDEYGFGLTEREQMELMESLSASGPAAIQNMVDASNRVFYPASRLGGGA